VVLAAAAAAAAALAVVEAGVQEFGRMGRSGGLSIADGNEVATVSAKPSRPCW